MEEITRIRPSVDFPYLLLLAARELHSPAFQLAFNDAISSMKKIANRAIETKDELIIEELKHLCVID